MSKEEPRGKLDVLASCIKPVDNAPMACPQRTLKNRLILPVALFVASILTSCVVWPSAVPDMTWDRKPVG
ncbi:MAG: hypothetical protein ACI9D0_002074, partial [Bacteroidia bacterium]